MSFDDGTQPDDDIPTGKPSQAEGGETEPSDVESEATGKPSQAEGEDPDRTPQS